MKVISSHEVKGRGTVHLVSQKDNPTIHFAVGETVMFDGKRRQIVSMECSDKNGVMDDVVGIILRPPYDYTKAKYAVVTATRAKKMGLNPSRHYGYYVTQTPKPPASRCPNPDFGTAAWCKTKTLAKQKVKDEERYIREGMVGCPCGSNRQQRGCCGV